MSAAVTAGIAVLEGGWQLNQVCGHSVELFQLLGHLADGRVSLSAASSEGGCGPVGVEGLTVDVG